MGDLFSDAASLRAGDVAPLALRLRPRTLDEFVGQDVLDEPQVMAMERGIPVSLELGQDLLVRPDGPIL